MKFIKRFDRLEGESYLDDTIISFGKNTLSKGTIGWYIKFTFPFAKKGLYIHPYTFEPTTGLVKYTFIYYRKPQRNYSKSKGYTFKGWYPLNKDINK